MTGILQEADLFLAEYAKITGACAVLFEENCCKSVGTFGDAKKLFVVPRGKNGKLLYNYNSLSTGRYLAF